MKQLRLHIGIMVMILLGLASTLSAQESRYVQIGSRHALAVPENNDYLFHWSMYFQDPVNTVAIPTTPLSNVTQDILWNQMGTYFVQVHPEDTTTHCLGEPIKLRVIVVRDLSLFAMNDIYYTHKDVPYRGSVAENDFDITGANMIYNPTPIDNAQHGSLSIMPDGSFTYTPNPGFVGVDSFRYEVFNDNVPPMFTSALVVIYVLDVNPRTSDLDIKKTGPAFNLIGNEINYDIVVKNLGPDIAYNVVIRDQIPFGLFNPTYSLNGSNFRPWTDSVVVNQLNTSDSIYLLFRGMVSVNSPEYLYNQAMVSSTVFDDSIQNNTSIWKTKVGPLGSDAGSDVTVASCKTKILDGSRSQSVAKIIKYEWSPGKYLSDSTSAITVFTPGESTQYVFTITDSLGNIASDTININVLPSPIAKTQDTVFFDNGTIASIVGSASTGYRITYNWTTDDGHIYSDRTNDTLKMDDIGHYLLTITDTAGCKSTDTTLVLYKSHPPIVKNDTLTVTAGIEGSINVLLNDRDSNDFNLHVPQLTILPNHASSYSFDSTGNIKFTPDLAYRGYDSLQYQVCNDGIPVECATGWLIIKVLRPPLNADYQITKTSDAISFYGDSIKYNITVFNAGPDTANVVTVVDSLNAELKGALYTTDGGATWKPWFRTVQFANLIPNKLQTIQIKALIDATAPRFITNKAYLFTDSTYIIENDRTNDTAVFVSKIKQPVEAIAGNDVSLGSCMGSRQLDASLSTGENIRFSWSPSQYLDNPTSAKPIFTPGATTTYILTVTDDDNISDNDTMTIFVLPPPIADAGRDTSLRTDQQLLLKGDLSSGAGIRYWWTTFDGNFVSNKDLANPVIDKVGTYTLTVTDSVGCKSVDSVFIYQFYYDPIANPDYYSTGPSVPVIGNVIANDYDPNGFPIAVTPGIIMTHDGQPVNMRADGSFDYTPRVGAQGIIDYFNYTLCNNAVPPRCASGYVMITISGDPPVIANLSIDKEGPEIAIRNDYVEFSIKVVNHGPETARQVTIRDSISQYISNPRLLDGKTNADKGVWTGGSPTISEILPGDTVFYKIKGKVKNTAPDFIFNAALVAATTMDDKTDWNDVANRNVDTVIVQIINGFLPKIAIYENETPPNINDRIIGSCNTNAMVASVSFGEENIGTYQWAPPEFFQTPNSKTSLIKPFVNDTLLHFQLIATGLTIDGVPGNTLVAKDSIYIARAPIANAGLDRKINDGDQIVVDASGSSGVEAEYFWSSASNNSSNIVDVSDPLHPIFKGADIYVLNVVDKYGCLDNDSVIVIKNMIHLLDDISLLAIGTSVTGNVATNDYDPNIGDTIYYQSTVVSGPYHGTLSLDAYNHIISTDGTFTYTPNPGYVGRDSFVYKACDSNIPSLCATGNVYIQVLKPGTTNNKPVANNDVAFANINTPIHGNVLSNDFDFDGNSIRVIGLATQASKGTIVVDSLGNYTYSPASFASGTDEFTYIIRDNGNPALYDTATVRITILDRDGMNHNPVAVDDAYYTVKKTINGNVLFNDFDPDGNAVSYASLVIPPSHNPSFVLNSDGSFAYTPNPSFRGTDQFVYKVCDDTIPSLCSYATCYIVCFDDKDYYADLKITKTATADTLSGSTITYKLLVENLGPSLANDVMVKDTVPSILTNVEFSVDSGRVFNPWIGFYKINRLLPYSQNEIIIRAQIPDVYNGSLTNYTSISGNMNELNLVNDSSKWVTSVHQKLIASLGNDTLVGFCESGLILDGSKNVGPGTIKYNWTLWGTNYDNPIGDYLNDSTIASPIFTPPVEPHGAIWFDYILEIKSIYDSITYTDKDTIRINVGQTAIADAGGDQYGEKFQSYILDGSNSTGMEPLKYQWWRNYNGIIDSISNEIITTVSKKGYYTLTITDPLNCVAMNTAFINYALEDYDAIDDYDTTFQQTPIKINVLRNDFIDPEDTYSSQSPTIITYPLNGTVTVNRADSSITYTPNDYFFGRDSLMYVAGGDGSTSGQAWVYIEVLMRAPIVSQGFSPNGDGINDFLTIQYIELYKDNTFKVINRWGSLVYSKKGYSNSDKWDGVANTGIKIGSGKLPSGTYFYILDLGNDPKIDKKIKDACRPSFLYIESNNK